MVEVKTNWTSFYEEIAMDLTTQNVCSHDRTHYAQQLWNKNHRYFFKW